MTQIYYRPIVQIDRCRPNGALKLAGGWSWFTHLERLERGRENEVVPAIEAPADLLENLTRARAPVCGLMMDQPRIMGILNTTPDSFSDGGKHNSFDGAVIRGLAMVESGADILDIGGESTRPGADFVSVDIEIERTTPVITALRKAGVTAPISIDTRKAVVAQAAIAAGAGLFNDVTALRYDTNSAVVACNSGAAVCLMHSIADPKTMQEKAKYSDVLLDVYDHLAERIAFAQAAGIANDKIVIDPGIGFGKTTEHCLELMRGLSLFHSLGCPILLGVSRKRFIGVIANAQNAAERGPGSVALGLEGLRQGVQILRVHDIDMTKQAVSLWQATL